MWKFDLKSLPHEKLVKLELKRKLLKSDLCQIGQLFRADVINRQKRGTEKQRETRRQTDERKGLKTDKIKRHIASKQKRTRKDNITK